MALRALCLCDGYGGFELGLKLAGIDVSTVARVERDAYAAAVLVARMEEARLDRCPVWDDLTTFDGAAWRGRVDIVTAGFPCQPFSTAGRQLGLDDERWLWPEIANIIADVGPRYVFLENVPGLVRLGLPDVLADLADLGFDAEWGLLSAAAVGAPHKRSRFWLLAYASGDGQHASVDRSQSDRSGLGRDVGRRVEVVAIPDGGGRVKSVPGNGPGCRQPDASRCNEDVGDASCVDEREQDHKARPVARGEPRTDAGWSGAWPPCRDDLDGWDRYIADGGPQPVIRRGADGRPPWLADAENGVSDMRPIEDLREQYKAALRSDGQQTIDGTPLTVRLFGNTINVGDCWEFQGTRTARTGHGRIANAQGLIRGAHRVAHQISFGVAASEGRCVCHTCDNPPCVNPEHLWVGSYAENNHDRDAKGRTRNQHTGRLSNRPEGISDALHLGGNGLVPLAAGHAFRQLLDRHTTNRKQ